MRYIINGQLIDEKHTDKVFEIIENHTGLDRRMAEAILHGGKSINHPSFTVTAANLHTKENERGIRP